MTEQAYNPLDKLRLAESVGRALLAQDSVRLGDVKSFQGAGIYAIYYVGDFEPYRAISQANLPELSQPIYVGKAIPKGGRKGGWGLGLDPGPVLSARLREHAKSIDQCENLALSDFYCRYVVVDDVWIPLAESLLIERFSPLWNIVLDGFGNHDPGSKRISGQRPAWDTVHPGRAWAEKLTPNTRDASELIDLALRFLAGDRSAQVISVQEAVLQDDSETE